MKHNYLDNYELVNGYALIDTDFSIITANEKMYKFLVLKLYHNIYIFLN